MATEAERESAIGDLVTGPAGGSNQMGSVNMPNPKDAIEADRYLRGLNVLDDTNENGGPASPWAALRPARGLPPGGRG